MNVSLGDVARHQTQNKGLRKIDAKDLRIIVRVAMHRLRLHFNIVKPGNRHALQKVLNVPVTALSRVGVWLLVNVEIPIIEGRLVRALQFLVLHKVTIEAPILRLHRRLPKTRLDQAIR